MIATTDTTSSMGKLRAFLCDADYDHGFCGCHHFHRNALLAFDGKYVCIIDFSLFICFAWSISLSLLTDNNLPGAGGLLKWARAPVEFLNSSTQATDKLLNFQWEVCKPETKEGYSGCDNPMVVNWSNDRTPALPQGRSWWIDWWQPGKVWGSLSCRLVILGQILAALTAISKYQVPTASSGVW